MENEAGQIGKYFAVRKYSKCINLYHTQLEPRLLQAFSFRPFVLTVAIKIVKPMLVFEITS